MRFYTFVLLIFAANLAHAFAVTVGPTAREVYAEAGVVNDTSSTTALGSWDYNLYLNNSGMSGDDAATSTYSQQISDISGSGEYSVYEVSYEAAIWGQGPDASAYSTLATTLTFSEAVNYSVDASCEGVFGNTEATITGTVFGGGDICQGASLTGTLSAGTYTLFISDNLVTRVKDKYAIISFSAAVPIPAAVWLFGSGLGLLGWMRRKATV
jgi:hypothetical protein